MLDVSDFCEVSVLKFLRGRGKRKDTTLKTNKHEFFFNRTRKHHDLFLLFGDQVFESEMLPITLQNNLETSVLEINFLNLIISSLYKLCFAIFCFFQIVWWGITLYSNP